jgi:hypothetical protein
MGEMNVMERQLRVSKDSWSTRYAIYTGARPSVMCLDYALAKFEQFERQQGEASVVAA